MVDAFETRWRWRRSRSGLVFSLMISVTAPVSPARAGDPEPKRGSVERADPAAVEFFEKNVRPILATRCQGCHGPAKQKGGLRLDARGTISPEDRPDRPSCPGTRRRACWSMRSTTAKPTRCHPNRSSPTRRSPP